MYTKRYILFNEDYNEAHLLSQQQYDSLKDEFPLEKLDLFVLAPDQALTSTNKNLVWSFDRREWVIVDDITSSLYDNVYKITPY